VIRIVGYLFEAWKFTKFVEPGGEVDRSFFDSTLEIVPVRPEIIRRLYKPQKSSSIFTVSIERLSTPVVIVFPSSMLRTGSGIAKDPLRAPLDRRIGDSDLSSRIQVGV
jgi:hypothetical protein